MSDHPISLAAVNDTGEVGMISLIYMGHDYCSIWWLHLDVLLACWWRHFNVTCECYEELRWSIFLGHGDKLFVTLVPVHT